MRDWHWILPIALFRGLKSWQKACLSVMSWANQSYVTSRTAYHFLILLSFHRNIVLHTKYSYTIILPLCILFSNLWDVQQCCIKVAISTEKYIIVNIFCFLLTKYYIKVIFINFTVVVFVCHGLLLLVTMCINYNKFYSYV